MIADICEKIEHSVSGGSSTNEFDNDFWFQSLGLVSVLINVFFFVAIWRIKELQVHPLKIFMWITACDATILFMSPSSVNVCRTEQYKLLSWTLFFSDSYRDYIISGFILYVLSMIIWYSAFYMSFFLNTALCVDLMIVLSNPFKPVENRTSIYLTVSTMATVAIYFISYIAVMHEDLDPNAIDVEYVLVFVPVVVFCLAAVISSVYAIYKLRSPGISNEVRKLVLRRHYITVLFNFIANLYIVVSMI